MRLEKSFIGAQHEEAQEVTIKRNEKAEPETLKMVPGHSEHELVNYKLGYDVGPSNPNPQNEQEAAIFAAQKKVCHENYDG